MLEFMRRHVKFFYIFFFIIILSFIYWGVGPMDTKDKENIVAEVGKYRIAVDEYWRTYEHVVRFYRDLYKDRFDEEMEKKMKLKERVLDSLIDEKVLLIAAKDLGISVSNEELNEAITHDPAFMRNGVFNKNVYLNRLRLNRITVEQYENSRRQELTLNKMKRLIWLSVDVPDTDSLKQVSDERLRKMLSEAMLNDRRDRALKSYIEGLKMQIKIKVNTEIIS